MLLAIFYLLLQFNVQAQTYVPFPDSNAVWDVYTVSDPDAYNSAFYKYLTFGDTVINGLEYTKLYKMILNKYCNTCPTDTLYVGAYRNDIPNKIVYFLQDSIEKILYNFSLNVGDTIPTTYYIETHGYIMTVCDIDSIQLENGEYRKQFTYEFPVQLETCDFPVVEGSGSLLGLLETMSFGEDAFQTVLVCNHVNDSLLFMSEWWEDCKSPEDTCIVGIAESNAPVSNGIEISPNPVKNRSHIRFINPKQIKGNYTLTLYNLVGVRVKTYSNIGNDNLVIDKNDYEAGVYIFVLRNGKAIVQTAKVIINP